MHGDARMRPQPTEKPSGKIGTAVWVLERGQARGQRQHANLPTRAGHTQPGTDKTGHWRFFQVRAIFLQGGSEIARHTSCSIPRSIPFSDALRG